MNYGGGGAPANNAPAGVLKSFKAFTLAEVLITLGIIGVVAAMTLPTLISNARYKELETGLKRGYSLIGQALNMYQAETGERLTDENVGSHELKPILLKYMKIAKDCGWGSEGDVAVLEKGCVPNYVNAGDTSKNSKIYKNFNGTNTIDLTYFDDGQFVLVDSSLILLENRAKVNVLYISVDVNGYLKNPNRLGQDLFMFQINEKGTLLPMGVEGTNYYSETDEYCSATSTNNMNGAGCTYKALTDKDYFKNLPK